MAVLKISVSTLDDVVNRIVDIINESERKLKRLKLEDDFVFENNFTIVLGYNIANDLVLEFKELCDMERSIIVFQNSSSPFMKNQELIASCEEAIKNGDGQKQYYEELMAILKKSFVKKIDELTEVVGYFIPREDREKFQELDRRFRFATMLKSGKENTVEQLRRGNINNPAASKRRIDRYVMIGKLIDLNLYRKNKADDNFLRRVSTLRQDLLSSKFFDIICLGMFGELTLESVKFLGYVYPKAEFNELLLELAKFGIFDSKELMGLQNNRNIILNPKLQELIGQLAVLPNLSIEGLKEFRHVEGIGEEGLNTMINILHTLKAINDKDYREYQEEAYKRKMTKEFGVPFNTFKREIPGAGNEEFLMALIEYAKSMGLGETREEILANLEKLQGDELRKTGTL